MLDEKSDNEIVDTKESDNENYLDQLDELDDDFDVEVKIYRAPQSFRSFAINPFNGNCSSGIIMCKTGQVKLPKELIQKFHHWDFENYHHMELMALLYLNYYKDSDEWYKKPNRLDNEIQDILNALPHFKSISELFTYAVINGDMKSTDFDQVIESDSTNSYDVTGLNED